MNKLFFVLFLALLVPCQSVWGQAVSEKVAVALAEKFVAQNGYTDAPPSQIKSKLDSESMESSENWMNLLQERRNTLAPKAIGAKKGRRGNKAGWSIAFDLVGSDQAGSDVCRVVTMNSDGSNIRIEHVDGLRKFFVGFNKSGA